MLGAQQTVEDLLHHDGVELDELRQGLDHFFLQGGQGGRSATARLGGGWAPASDPFLLSLPGPLGLSFLLNSVTAAPSSRPCHETYPLDQLTDPPTNGVLSSSPPPHTRDGAHPRSQPTGNKIQGSICWGRGASYVLGTDLLCGSLQASGQGDIKAERGEWLA